MSETEIVSIESVDSQKPAKRFCSDIWDYFKRMQVERKCGVNYVNTEYAYLVRMSNLRDHLIRYHKDKYKQSDTIESGDKQQTSLDIFWWSSQVSTTKCQKDNRIGCAHGS